MVEGCLIIIQDVRAMRRTDPPEETPTATAREPGAEVETREVRRKEVRVDVGDVWTWPIHPTSFEYAERRGKLTEQRGLRRDSELGI